MGRNRKHRREVQVHLQKRIRSTVNRAIIYRHGLSLNDRIMNNRTVGLGLSYNF